MNANAIEGTDVRIAAGGDEALYVPSDDRQLFGWLHRPPGTAPARWGVVLCKPFGFEALCGHHSMRAFAGVAASLGIPVLRFDYLGTGDSEEIDPSADQIEVWVRDIVNAVAELRRRTGVARVCLLGFRLGALLSVLAARQCHIEALALIAPVLSGRKYLREARTAQLAAEAAEAALGAIATARTGAADGAMEVNGFPLSAATVARLGALDIEGVELPGVTDVLFIDRGDLPVARGFSQTLGERGVQVAYHALPGFVEMMLTDPQFASRPVEMLAAARNWFLTLATVSRQAWPAGSAATFVSRSTVLTLHGAAAGVPGSTDARITERPVFFGANETLFGIVTAPEGQEMRRRVVILLNAGATYHIGSSRMYVSLARRWAQRGYCVLRMDLSGLGESRPRAGCDDNNVFPPGAIEDIRAAIDFMSQRYAAHDITLSGLCSGAYHSLRAAIAGLPLQRLLMVNAQNYFWDQTMTLEGLQLAEVVRNPTIYRERIFSAAAWRRVLTGQVNIWRIVKIYFHRPVLALKSMLRDIARAGGIRLRQDLGRELETVIGKGVRVVFVFARGEAGIDLLRIEAGSTVRRLGERCRLRIIASADHTFSRSGPRQVLEEVLSDELFAHQDADPAAAAPVADKRRGI
ncbi:MAG TPA: alpha/beta fold hydrolase [Steroidobacteraceae bacterium]|nr:alpha/beta fold hydrolase [Steroidobacteraceae bacterium]